MNMVLHDLGFSHRACDRCHGQKLRCRRESNSNTCVRCARAGVRCTPRPMKLRSRAQSTKDPPQRRESQPHANGDSAGQHPVNQEEGMSEANDEHPDHFDYLPPSLLDLSTELDLGLDSSSLQADIHIPLTAPCGSADTESRAHSLHASGSQPPYPPAPSHLRTAEQAVQTHWSDLPNQDTSDDLGDFSSPVTMPPPFPSTHHGQHYLSLARNMPPQRAHEQGPDDMMVDFGHAAGNSQGSDGKGSQTDCGDGRGLSPFELLRSPFMDAQDSDPELRTGNHHVQKDPLNPISDAHRSNKTSWVRRLSDANVQLHQHMHSIPAVGTGQRGQGSASRSPLTSSELPVDSTLRLSDQYTGLLTSICAQIESYRSCTDPETLAKLVLDQPSQLLVLSSYICLLAAYDKILQHIKAWLDVRLKMGFRGGSAITLDDDDENSLCFPTQLPRLAVGSFELSKTSSLQSLVLTCIMKTNVMHMHSLIGEIMRPVSNSVTESASKTATSSGSPAAEKRRVLGVAGVGDGLSTVAKVTLQAIEDNEDSTLQLVHAVSKLALRRVML